MSKWGAFIGTLVGAVLGSLACGSLLAADAGLSPERIIQNVDEIRNPGESYFMKVEVQGGDAGAEPAVFEVSIQGNAKTLVKTLAPVRDRGRNLLMLEENMWAYIPNLKRAVRVGLGQKLTGQAANGDISRMRWSGDYSPLIESEDAGQWVLLLSAQKKGLTYEKIRVWVEKKTSRPLRAEFLTPQGKVLKKAEYREFRALAGRERPTQMVIQDAVREAEVSTIKILTMEARSFPESLFNQSALQGY